MPSPPSKSDKGVQQQSSTKNPSRSERSKKGDKKRLNRVLASCSGCRRRRTRCDRLLPCSECTKRKVTCDYHGASLPTIAARRNLNSQTELKEEIKRLESELDQLQRDSRTNKLTLSNSHGQSSGQSKQDFTIDGLATALSNVTLGHRWRFSTGILRNHPLGDQLESIVSSPNSQRIPLVSFGIEEQFSLSLNPSSSTPNLKSLINDHLPTRAQFNLVSLLYFKTVNVWNTAINYRDWNRQISMFWDSSDRIEFRPFPHSSDPPDQTIHQLAHFVSCVFSVSAHGLYRLAEMTRNTPNPTQCLDDTLLRLVDLNQEFCHLTHHQKVGLAHKWFRYSLGLLTSQEGDIFGKPTVFGMRAMFILGQVGLPPEEIDRVTFFWRMTSKLTESTGLFKEPPIGDDEDLERFDDVEIECRRHLAWSILSFAWIAVEIGGVSPYYCEPSRYKVKLPGTTESPATKIHPDDGWPMDPFVASRRALALISLTLYKIDLKVYPGNLVTYDEVLELENEMKRVESSIPDRFQVVLSSDRRSVQPKIPTDPLTQKLGYYIIGRLSIAFVKIHRIFIAPKPDVSTQERYRHMTELVFQARRHFLLAECLTDGLNMHPLMLYGLASSAIARSLVILEAPEMLESGDESKFFRSEIEKLIRIFHHAETTVACGLARKSVAILTMLLERIERFRNSSNSLMMGSDRRKKGRTRSGIPESLVQGEDVDRLKPRRVKRCPAPTMVPHPSSSSAQCNPTLASVPFDHTVLDPGFGLYPLSVPILSGTDFSGQQWPTTDPADELVSVNAPLQDFQGSKSRNSLRFESGGSTQLNVSELHSQLHSQEDEVVPHGGSAITSSGKCGLVEPSIGYYQTRPLQPTDHNLIPGFTQEDLPPSHPPVNDYQARPLKLADHNLIIPGLPQEDQSPSHSSVSGYQTRSLKSTHFNTVSAGLSQQDQPSSDYSISTGSTPQTSSKMDDKLSEPGQAPFHNLCDPFLKAMMPWFSESQTVIGSPPPPPPPRGAPLTGSVGAPFGISEDGLDPFRFEFLPRLPMRTRIDEEQRSSSLSMRGDREGGLPTTMMMMIGNDWDHSNGFKNR